MAIAEEIGIVEKAKAGDIGAYDELIHRTSRLVWACVYGIIYDTVWMEDIVQDVFLKGWQMIETLREPSAFRSWILMIARRCALDHNERLSRQVQLIREHIPFQKLNYDDTEMVREEVHNALMHLPERYRLPLTLRYLEGLDYDQIGEQLGLTNGSLRGLLNRGMKLLRQEFGVLEK